MRLTALAVFWAAVAPCVFAQIVPGYNYDESKIQPYKMLDPLTRADGAPVRNAAQWQGRRVEILHLFEQNIYGRTPDAAKNAVVHARIVEQNSKALDGLAVREQIELTIDPAPGVVPPPTAERRFRLLLYIPSASASAHRPSPAILGMNFNGNQTVIDDTAIQPTEYWSRPKGSTEIQHALPADSTRGSAAQQWQVRTLLEHGYALATFYYGDLEPDLKDAEQYSARQLFRAPNAATQQDEWGALGLWAWGLSRALDYLSIDPLIDPSHVAVFGFSRLGKAADWAAAQDTRFAAILSNESGHGGQSIQRRAIGETVAHLEHSFPWWFCPQYASFVDRDAQIPADGNLLLATLAPRPVYVGSAAGDSFSDPHGEFLSAVSASRVYRLLGKAALAPDTPQPALDIPIGTEGLVAYHERTGKHDVTAFDWDHYVAFLDARWGSPLGRPAVGPAGLPPPPLPAHPASAAQIARWRTEMRRALYIPEPLPPSAAQTYSSSELVPGVTMEKLSFVTAYGLRVPAIIYRPTKPPASRLPAIVVVNGHGADKTSWYSWYTGVLYARAGAVVLTYDPIGEGERNDDHKDATGEHDALIPSPVSMPVRLGGLMVTDAMQAVSTLSARADVDPHRIAVMGFSMGSFIASLTGAADPRIHALLLVGGGDLDGPDGYWDSGHAIMCQAAPYKALRFLGDRGAVLFTLSARRGDTFIINGTADTVVAIPTHGPDFFAELRARVVTLNGRESGVFSTYFDAGASHRPSWMTPRAAEWLNHELGLPAWSGSKGTAIAQLPTTSIADWAKGIGLDLGKSGSRADRDGGIVALAADVPLLTPSQLNVLTPKEWQSRKGEFVYSSWITRAQAAAATQSTWSGRLASKTAR